MHSQSVIAVRILVQFFLVRSGISGLIDSRIPGVEGIICVEVDKQCVLVIGTIIYIDENSSLGICLGGIDTVSTSCCIDVLDESGRRHSTFS